MASFDLGREWSVVGPNFELARQVFVSRVHVLNDDGLLVVVVVPELRVLNVFVVRVGPEGPRCLSLTGARRAPVPSVVQFVQRVRLRLGGGLYDPDASIRPLEVLGLNQALHVSVNGSSFEEVEIELLLVSCRRHTRSRRIAEDQTRELGDPSFLLHAVGPKLARIPGNLGVSAWKGFMHN